MSSPRIFIGVGSNLEDPGRQVEDAIERLGTLDGCRLVRASSLYHTAPWGIEDQPAFVNAVVELACDCEPATLLERLLALESGRLHLIALIHHPLALESGLGRKRAVRWGPRVIDLDILAWGERTVDQPGLTIPHPRLADRDFVLVPWAEIAPDFQVPELGTVAELSRAAAHPDRPAPRRLEATPCTQAATTAGD